MPESQIIEFHYDISCPFAYIASTKVAALAQRTNAKILWKPILLGAVYRATNAPQGAAGSASDTFNPTKRAVTGRAFTRTIQRHGIPHNTPAKHPQKTTAALRLLYFVHETARPLLTHALYRAYWVDGKDVEKKETLIQAVRECELWDGDRIIKAIVDGSTDGPEQRKQLEEATDLALQRGVFGVPAFWIPNEIWKDSNGKEQKGRLYWGQDRMHFVEGVIMALNEGKNGNSLGQVSRPLRNLIPRCKRSPISSGEEVKLEFWYDFSSPWAYLGWTQLPSLQRQFGSQLQIDMKPFLLGILFREIGAPNLPMAAISPTKRAYSQWDHQCWVRWWRAIATQENLPDPPIAFHWASQFPIRTPTVLRAVLAEPRLHDALYRACWERDLNMSDDAVLERVISEVDGYDGKQVLAKANSPDVKAELRKRTKEAQDHGICGVPTYRVFRRKKGEGEEAWKQHGDLVWGQDEIGVVEDLIAGWDGEGVQSIGEGRTVRGKL